VLEHAAAHEREHWMRLFAGFSLQRARRRFRRSLVQPLDQIRRAGTRIAGDGGEKRSLGDDRPGAVCERPCVPSDCVAHHAHAESLVLLVVLVALMMSRRLRCEAARTRDRRGACRERPGGLSTPPMRLPLPPARINPVTEDCTARSPLRHHRRRDGLLKRCLPVKSVGFSPRPRPIMVIPILLAISWPILVRPERKRGKGCASLRGLDHHLRGKASGGIEKSVRSVYAVSHICRRSHPRRCACRRPRRSRGISTPPAVLLAREQR